jgi:hypothetical protein
MNGTELKDMPEQQTNIGETKSMNGAPETTIQIDEVEEKDLFTIVEKNNRSYTLRVKFEHEVYYAGEEVRGMVELVSKDRIEALPSVVIVFKLYSNIKIRGTQLSH